MSPGKVSHGHPPTSMPRSTVSEGRHNELEKGMATPSHSDQMKSRQGRDAGNDRSEKNQETFSRMTSSSKDTVQVDQGRHLVENEGPPSGGLLRGRHRDVFTALTDEITDSSETGRIEKVKVPHNTSFSGNGLSGECLLENTPENSGRPETSRQVEQPYHLKKGVRHKLDAVDESLQVSGASIDDDYLGKSREKTMKMVDFSSRDSMQSLDAVPGKEVPERRGLKAGQKEAAPEIEEEKQRFEAPFFDTFRVDGREAAQTSAIGDMKAGKVSAGKKGRVEVKIGTISMDIYQAPRPQSEMQVVRPVSVRKNNNGSPSSSRLHRFYLKGW